MAEPGGPGGPGGPESTRKSGESRKVPGDAVARHFRVNGVVFIKSP